MDFKPIILITAPSGAGKTSITKYLLQEFPSLSFSISATTRLPRGNEQDGVDYYFLSLSDFQKKIAENAFLEWEMVYEGKYYGTLLSELDRMWDLGLVPLLDIDVKGAIHVQQKFPESTLSFFIEAPSLEALETRLRGRGTDTEENIQTRLNKAQYEMSFKQHFNHIIINDNLDEACKKTASLIYNFINKKLRK
jgi:guanylate kinase